MRTPESRSNAPGRPRSERTHAKVLQATAELVAEVGYQQLTIEGIAARAGVGKATIYRWWPNKGSLVLETLRELIPLPSIPHQGDARADLRDAIKITLTTLANSTTGAVLAELAADLARDPALAAAFRIQFADRREALQQILRNAITQGLLPADVDIALLLDTFLGALFYRILFGTEPLTDSIVEQLVALVLDQTPPSRGTATGVSPLPTSVAERAVPGVHPYHASAGELPAV